MAYIPNRPTQSYQTADQSAYVGVAGNNQANQYLRYKEELDRQKREREEAERKAKAGWWKRGLGNAATGALTGFLAGGPVGAGIGAAGGFGLSAIGDATGMQGMSYGGGAGSIAGLAGGAAGGAYQRWASAKGPAPAPEGSPDFMGPPQAGAFDVSPGYSSNPAYYDEARRRMRMA